MYYSDFPISNPKFKLLMIRNQNWTHWVNAAPFNSTSNKKSSFAAPSKDQELHKSSKLIDLTDETMQDKMHRENHNSRIKIFLKRRNKNRERESKLMNLKRMENDRSKTKTFPRFESKIYLIKIRNSQRNLKCRPLNNLLQLRIIEGEEERDSWSNGDDDS